MAKKKLLLNESVTRRFMKLATIKPAYVSNFITEADAEEDEELMADDPMGEPAPEGEEVSLDAEEPPMDDELEVEDELSDPVGDESATDAEALVMDLLAKVQEFAKENGVSMELEGDEAEGEEGMEDELEGDMELEEPIEDVEPEGGELPGEAEELGEPAGEEEVEMALQEANISLLDEKAIVAEVTRRVAKRLLKASTKRK